eukprot:5551593-Alexandrium_andersonii.AAC.1
MAHPLVDRRGRPLGGSAAGDFRNIGPRTHLPDYVQEFVVEQPTLGPALQAGLYRLAQGQRVPSPSQAVLAPTDVNPDVTVCMGPSNRPRRRASGLKASSVGRWRCLIRRSRARSATGARKLANFGPSGQGTVRTASIIGASLVGSRRGETS